MKLLLALALVGLLGPAGAAVAHYGDHTIEHHPICVGGWGTRVHQDGKVSWDVTVCDGGLGYRLRELLENLISIQGGAIAVLP